MGIKQKGQGKKRKLSREGPVGRLLKFFPFKK